MLIACVGFPLDWESRQVIQGLSPEGLGIKCISESGINDITTQKCEELPPIMKIRVSELFTHREGISTPRARHKGRQPLIECAQCDFKIIYFPKSGELLLLHYFIILLFLIFSESTKVLPLLLRIPRCNEEVKPTQFFKSEYLYVKLILCFLKYLFYLRTNSR